MSDATTEETGTDVEAVEEVASDERREALRAEVRSALGDALIEDHLIPGRDLWVRVDAGRWVEVVQALSDLGFDYFGFLSGLDWKIAEWGRYEDTPFGAGDVVDDAETTTKLPEGSGYAGGDTRFQALLRLHSTRRGLGINVKADLDDELPELPTISRIYPGADWHERETWEMFGFNFAGHPHQAHIYLPGDFEGNPLRKDFPLLARVVKPWPGVVDVEPIPEHLEAALERAVLDAAEGGDES